MLVSINMIYNFNYSTLFSTAVDKNPISRANT